MGFEVAVEGRIESAHRIMEDTGKCGKLHGHRWEFNVNIEVQYALQVDANDLKKHLQEVLVQWDHKVLLKRGDPLAEILFANAQHVLLFDESPTVEHLAFRLHSEMCKKGYDVSAVTCWETSTISASYS